MKQYAVAERYSRSVFELAEEKGSSKATFQELLAVKDAMQGRPELLQLLHNPLITKEEKYALIEGILGTGASAVAKHFLNLLVAKGRVDLFPVIVEQLQNAMYGREGVQEVTIVTARTLHESIVQLLEKALIKTTGKKILIESETDPSILGGIQIRIGNRLIDGSVRTKLEALEKQLRNTKVI